MFGLFKSPEKKIMDRAGKEIHRQMLSATKDTNSILNSLPQIVFVKGYITSFLFNVAYETQSQGDWCFRDENLKYLCDGVIPGRLWDAFLKARAVEELGDQAPFNVEEILESGRQAADSDVWDDIGVSNNLYNYLTNKPLNIRSEVSSTGFWQ